MTPDDIKSKFFTYIDQWTTYFPNSELNDIFFQASVEYWQPLMDKWGYDLRVDTAIAPLVATYNVTPASNVLDTSTSSTDLPNYNRIGVIMATFTVSGTAYTNQCKPYDQNNRLSPYSAPTYRYPGFDIINEQINIYPTTPVVTRVTGQYLTNFPTIDFDDATDIAISDENVMGLIQKALPVAYEKIKDKTGFDMSLITGQTAIREV